MNSLELKNITKHFDGVAAVSDLSIKINPGAITSIIGPNGAGKTTLINLLSGILPLVSGVLVFGNKKYFKLKPYQMPQLGVTRTFQTVRLFEQMTVLDNILVVLTKRGVLASIFERSNKATVIKAEKILRTVGLDHKKNDLAINLSYGQRKLLEIGRALAMEADIYLFDEPFAGLFHEMVTKVVGLIMQLKKSGKTVVLIEHNMDLIRQLSDQVIVLDSGKLLAQGKPNEVLAKPEVIEAYLGE